MITVDTILPICSHNSRKMFVFISLFFCLALSRVSATCLDRWVDASEYDLGNLKLRKIVDNEKSALGCLLLHDRELNHKQHSWGASSEFCAGLGNGTRLVEIHTPEQKEALTKTLSNIIKGGIVMLMRCV